MEKEKHMNESFKESQILMQVRFLKELNSWATRKILARGFFVGKVFYNYISNCIKGKGLRS